MIAENGWRDAAAVASRRAGELYGLNVLDEDIQVGGWAAGLRAGAPPGGVLHPEAPHGTAALLRLHPCLRLHL